MDGHYLMNRTKRIRTPSYSRLEQQILLDLIDTHRMVLDCKASDASTNHKKNIAWEEIANQYNNCGGVETVRTVHQLKRCWENMKMRLKNQSLQYGGGGGGGGKGSGRGGGSLRNDSFIKTDADSFVKNDADSQIEHIVETSSEEKYRIEPVSSTPGRTESDEDTAHLEWLNGYGTQASSIADEMRARLAPVSIKSEGGTNNRANQRQGGGATLTGIMNKLSARSTGSRNNSSVQCASKVLATARALQTLHTTSSSSSSLKRLRSPSHQDQGGGDGGREAAGFDLELETKRRVIDETEQQQQQELYLLNLDEARSRAEEARYRAEEARLRVDEARLRVSNIERERERGEELHSLKCKHLQMELKCRDTIAESLDCNDKEVV